MDLGPVVHSPQLRPTLFGYRDDTILKLEDDDRVVVTLCFRCVDTRAHLRVYGFDGVPAVYPTEELYDLREDVSFLWKLAPHKVFLSQDGREISAFTFDSLHRTPDLTAQKLVLVNTQKGFTETYESPWRLRLGSIKLVPGETTVTVFASDFAGNESSEGYGLTVLE